MASGAERISAVAAMSTEERRAFLDDAFERMAAAKGDIALGLGEVDRGQEYREEGATSTESWVVERYGVSTATARALTHVGEKAWDIPDLIGSLCTGDISFDKVRAVADVVTPETDHELCEQARRYSVRDLADIARSTAALTESLSPPRSDHDRRFLRFNDQHRTMTVQLPADSFAETRASIEAGARLVPSDGETPWDQRCCDAFMEKIRSSAGTDGTETTASPSPFLVVVHVPVAAFVENSSETTTLAGDLERHGLIDRKTVQRIACDASLSIAVDDDVGHTMYEGRARRFPTQAQRREVLRRDRHCRFPDCTNVTFTNVHHIVPWDPGGRTDLDNLALTCLYHHHLVHSGGWTMSGNANEELTFVGPTGRVMTSRPSPLWTRVTAGLRSGRSD
jgi:Domain of unknown function (DUF222)/HNH endonuclease